MRTREQEIAPLVNLSQISEIELVILKRMREFTLGEHRSLFHGNGFDFVGLRNWEAGDRFEHIDWAQSSLTNFSPLVIRDFEQPSTAGVVVVADHSRSTRCGVDALPEGVAGPAAARGNVLIAHAVARAIATIGMSAVFFQDTFGMVTFQGGFDQLQAIRPRVGKNQVIHCLDAYQYRGRARGSAPARQPERLAGRLPAQDLARAGGLRLPVRRRRSGAGRAGPRSTRSTTSSWSSSTRRSPIACRRCRPAGSRRWTSRRAARGWSRAGSWPAWPRRCAAGRTTWRPRRRSAGLDVLRLDLDDTKSDIALAEFAVERRLRKR